MTFRQPAEYRVHDLEWGNAINVSMQEANQSDGFAVKFSDQGVGHLNPDFRFGVGYNFLFSGMFVINGDFIFDGDVDPGQHYGADFGRLQHPFAGSRRQSEVSPHIGQQQYVELLASRRFYREYPQFEQFYGQRLPGIVRRSAGAARVDSSAEICAGRTDAGRGRSVFREIN